MFEISAPKPASVYKSVMTSALKMASSQCVLGMTHLVTSVAATGKEDNAIGTHVVITRTNPPSQCLDKMRGFGAMLAYET